VVCWHVVALATLLVEAKPPAFALRVVVFDAHADDGADAGEAVDHHADEGAVARHRQAEIMRELQEPQKPPAADEDRLRQIAEEVFRAKSATESPRALATAALGG
jgi:hypothetical protein